MYDGAQVEGMAGRRVRWKLDEGSHSVNDRAAQLSSRILKVIKDEPFEDVMPMLGTIQVFLLMDQADDPVLAVDRVAQFMRTQVRELVNTDGRSRNGGCHHDEASRC